MDWSSDLQDFFNYNQKTIECFMKTDFFIVFFPIFAEGEDGSRPSGLPPRLLLGGAPGKGRHGVLLDAGRTGGRAYVQQSLDLTFINETFHQSFRIEFRPPFRKSLSKFTI